MNDTLSGYLEDLKDHPEFDDLEEIRPESRNRLGNTPLHFAVIQNNKEIVSLLLGEGVDPNIKGEHGYTPLHEGVEQGSVETVRVLLASGRLKLDVQNDDGKTALELAELLEKQTLINLLKQCR